jgi:hypothetical protein
MEFSQPSQETVDGKQFTVVEGTWKNEFVERWRQSGVEGEDTSRLPDHVPDRVRIYVDQNSFPRRFLYLKQPRGSKIERPIVTFDFAQVVLNAPISEDDFQFVPPDGVFPIDVTNQYLQQLIPAAPGPGPSSPSAAPEPAGQPDPAAPTEKKADSPK